MSTRSSQSLAWFAWVSLLACRELPEQKVSAKHAALPTESAQPTDRVTAPSVVAPVVASAEPSADVTKAAAMAVPAEPVAPTEPAAPAAPPSLCSEQAPQSFLVNAHYDSFLATGGSAREWQQVLDKAVRYRTEQYGYVKGFGSEAWNASSAQDQALIVTFFGVSVAINRRIAPALACVETAIRARCADHPYQPYVLSGLRKRNTYLNGEASNHVYGIALDVDPTRNPCCGCVAEWHESDRCQNEKTKFQRMDMPSCWVTEFERFGFYWLGHAKIEDTMHFEFLADPGKIVRQSRR